LVPPTQGFNQCLKAGFGLPLSGGYGPQVLAGFERQSPDLLDHFDAFAHQGAHRCNLFIVQGQILLSSSVFS
jgi:hypothetical protein